MGIVTLFLVVLYILCLVFYYFNQNLIFLVFCFFSLGFLVKCYSILQKQRLLKQIKVESNNLKNIFLKNERINLTDVIKLNNIFKEFAAKISFDTQKASNDIKKNFQELSIIKTGLNDSNNAVKNIAENIVSISELWDRNYIPIPNTKPQKYQTRFTQFIKDYIQPIKDKLLVKDPNFSTVVIVDNNGYLQTHNSKYDKPLAGDY
jgi:hypothetical protein